MHKRHQIDLKGYFSFVRSSFEFVTGIEQLINGSCAVKNGNIPELRRFYYELDFVQCLL